MSEPDARGDKTERNAAPSGDGLEDLRGLLLGPEQKQIAALRERLENPATHAEHISEVLPAAVRISAGRGQQLTHALGPSVESALKESVRRDPSVVTDAIFPVIGPAIRKAIAEAMRKIVESLNQTLEHTLSIESFKWRLEARRTGKTFAEVVLSRTLLYRVEQVFLVHKETGLLLQHVQRMEAAASDKADMVSGMLTAIQDFARDSFNVSQSEGLETMQVGELNVWIETSPRMTVAAVIRGLAPQDFREVLRSALEQLHREQRALLDSFSGDAGPFEVVRPRLEECLRQQRSERRKSKLSRSIPLLLLLLLLFAGVVSALFVASERRHRQAEEQRQQDAALAAEQRQRAATLAEERRRQDAATAREQAVREAEAARLAGLTGKLRAQEGIVVVEAGKRDGRFQIAGLRDPLSIDPAKVVAELGIAQDEVNMHWEPYQALTPTLVLERARRRLHPPATVRLRMQGDTLVAEGTAPEAWIADARRLAELLPGVAAFESGSLRDETAAFIEAAKRQIERAEIVFDQGSALVVDQEAALDRVTAQVMELKRATTSAGRTLRLAVRGHTSADGPDALNARLNRERAESVITLLKARGVDPSILVSGSAARESEARAGEAAKRCATFAVLIGEPKSGGSRP